MTRQTSIGLAALTAVALVVSAAAPRAAQDISKDLHSSDPHRRAAAVERLGALGNPASAVDVAPLIADPDDLVQLSAIDAELTFFLVEPIGDRKATISLKSGARSRPQMAFDAGPLVRAATIAPSMVINQLIAATRDDNARVRFDAIHALGVVAEGPLTSEQQFAIAEGLGSKDPVMRAATARVLGRAGARDTGEKLIAALNDDNTLVQRFATEALGRIREERAVTSLVERADFYGRGQMAAESWLAVARIGHASARDEMRAHLGDGDPAIRRAAVEGLGRMQDRDSLAAISALQADRDASVRTAVPFALAELGDPSRLGELGVALQVTSTAGQATDYLLELGATAAPAVTAALTDRGVVGRADLLHVLGRIGGANALATIQSFAQSPDARVARAAADAALRAGR